MKFVVTIELEKEQKPREKPRSLVVVGKIFRGLAKCKATRAFAERDYDLLDAPGIEVAS
jgi:hypothetical protein